MEVKPRRLPRWIIFLSILGNLFVAFLILGFFINSKADKRWSQARRKAQTLLEELPVFDGRRPILYGESLSGNAWVEYKVAFEKIQELEAKDLFETKAYRTQSESRAKVVLAIANRLGALQALSRGAHRAEATWEYQWEQGGNTTVPAWDSIATLLAVQRAYAWLELDAGETRKSCEALLDAAQLARDSFAGGSVTQADFALKWLDELSEDLRAFLVSDKVKPDDLGRLERGLRLLETSFPKLHDLLRREVVCGCFTLLAGPEGTTDPQHLQASYRIDAAEAIDLIERALTESEGCDELPWLDVAAKQNELALQMQGSSLVDLAYPEFRRKVVEAWRSRRAQYLLLRVGAHYLATGEAQPQPDPMGTTLQIKVEGRTLRAWSVGVDGVNDGGDPGKDFVLEVTRP